jgi:hypothetical protein
MCQQRWTRKICNYCILGLFKVHTLGLHNPLFQGRPRSNIALQPALSAATGSSKGIYRSEYSTYVGSLMAKSAKICCQLQVWKYSVKLVRFSSGQLEIVVFMIFGGNEIFGFIFTFFTFNWNYEKIWVVRRHTIEIHSHTKYISLVLIEKYLLTTVLKLHI